MCFTIEVIVVLKIQALCSASQNLFSGLKTLMFLVLSYTNKAERKK